MRPHTDITSGANKYTHTRWTVITTLSRPMCVCSTRKNLEGWSNEVIRSHRFAESLTTYPAFLTASGMASRPVPTLPFSRWMKVWRSLHRRRWEVGEEGGGRGKEKERMKAEMDKLPKEKKDGKEVKQRAVEGGNEKLRSSRCASSRGQVTLSSEGVVHLEPVIVQRLGQRIAVRREVSGRQLRTPPIQAHPTAPERSNFHLLVADDGTHETARVMAAHRPAQVAIARRVAVSALLVERRAQGGGQRPVASRAHGRTRQTTRDHSPQSHGHMRRLFQIFLSIYKPTMIFIYRP